MPERLLYLHPTLDKEEVPYWEDNNEIYVSVVESQANLVSSKLDNNLHLPVLDIDFPIKIEPSTTAEHFHLYLDGMKPITWRQYKKLLKALAASGIIEEGYYQASLNRGMTLVRRPGVKKILNSKRIKKEKSYV